MERTLKRQFMDLVGDYYEITDNSYSNGTKGLKSTKKGIRHECGYFNFRTGVISMDNETDALVIDQLIIEQNKQNVFKVILD